MTDTPTPGAQTTTLQVMTYNAQTDAHTLVLDLNDHGAFTLRPQGLTMAQPPKVDSRSSNLRVPGERVVKWQYKNRHITVHLNLRALTPADSTSTTQLLTDVRNLLAAVEHPPYELRIALPKATQYSYVDVVQCTHTIPSDPQEILAGAIRTVAIDFECLPGLRGDRLTLQNLVFNPGFEAPSGPGVTAFSDTFANFNAYTVQAGGALTQDSTYYADAVLADSPVAYYRLDETSGSTVYDAINGRNLTSANCTPAVAGLLNGDPDICSTLNGTTSTITGSGFSGLPSGNAAWTIEAWVKVAAYPAAQAAILGFGVSATSQIPNLYMTTSGGIVGSQGGGGAHDSTASAAVSKNVAHQVAVSWDGTTMRCYLDGAQFTTLTPGACAIPTTGQVIAIGVRGDGTAQFFGGQVDECAIYATALSAARITAHYNAGHNAPVANQANTMVIPSGGRISFGSPAWGSLNTWQVRFRYVAGLTATFFLHYIDGANSLYAQVYNNGQSLQVCQLVAGVNHVLGSTSMTLTNGVPYWLTVTQFPTVSGNNVMVQAQLWGDLNNTITSIAKSSLIGPIGSFDAVTALSGAPQIAASGAALALGGGVFASHSVALFRPGSWYFASAGTGAAALATDTATTWPNGPVTSVHAARISAPPAGTLDARLVTSLDGVALGTHAIPVRTAGDVLYMRVAARSAGLGNGATVALEYNEYDVNGNFLRSGTLQTLTISGGVQIAWPAAGVSSLSGHWTTGASCAYVDLQLHVADTVAANSAGASVWFDNAQCWNATSTGQTSMDYHELNFPMTPAQVMVSGLAGDMETPCLFAFGAFWSSFAPGNAATLAVGRRAQASAGALLVGAPVNFYGSGSVTTPVLDSTSYSGYYIQTTVTSAGWNPRGFSAHPADLLGTYHLWNRFKSGQSAGNLANVQQRVATFAQTDAWIGLANGTDLLGVSYGLWNAPLSASATWTVCDAGQVAIPPFNLGAATDPTQNYVTPRPQVQDLTGGGSTCQMSWELLLPVDASLMLATINNPSNSPVTITNGYLWTYFDGLGVLQGNPATWGYSQESTSLPNVAHSSGGNGTTSSGTINVNPTADTLLTLDPSQKVAGVVVNQFGLALSDATGLSAASLAQIQYTPLYLYPR